MSMAHVRLLIFVSAVERKRENQEQIIRRVAYQYLKLRTLSRTSRD